MTAFRSFILFIAVLFTPCSGFCLSADQIAVIVNRQEPQSLKLAKFYMEQRHIPATHLITIDTDPKEECSRSEYDRFIATPVRQFLKKNGVNGSIRCLVTIYGVPLKITTPAISDQGSETIGQLTKKIEDITFSMKQIEDTSLIEGLNEKIKEIKQQISYFTKVNDMRSSVDSELTLVTVPHPLPHWLPNPYFRGHQNEIALFDQKDIFMVSRLDGSGPDLVRARISDMLAAEKEGLHGDAFFDARWPDPGLKRVDNYGWYDRSIHQAAEVVRQSRKMRQVVIDNQTSLFQPGVIRNAALYCGWYSRAQYVDAFNWQRGAVGYHIASSECVTLKNKESNVWCKKMLEKGVAATLGPVGEPYVDAFPPPDLFFAFLTGGKNLVESYFFSLPHLSWKMVLIGDPLYTPFHAR